MVAVLSEGEADLQGTKYKEDRLERVALNALTLESLVETTFMWHGFLVDAEELAY